MDEIPPLQTLEQIRYFAEKSLPYFDENVGVPIGLARMRILGGRYQWEPLNLQKNMAKELKNYNALVRCYPQEFYQLIFLTQVFFLLYKDIGIKHIVPIPRC